MNSSLMLAHRVTTRQNILDRQKQVMALYCAGKVGVLVAALGCGMTRHEKVFKQLSHNLMAEQLPVRTEGELGGLGKSVGRRAFPLPVLGGGSPVQRGFFMLSIAGDESDTTSGAS